MVEIKLIDLLNKIAENKPLPRKIRFKATDYKMYYSFTYDKDLKGYYCNTTHSPLIRFIQNNFANINNKIIIDEGEVYI